MIVRFHTVSMSLRLRHSGDRPNLCSGFPSIGQGESRLSCWRSALRSGYPSVVALVSTIGETRRQGAPYRRRIGLRDSRSTLTALVLWLATNYGFMGASCYNNINCASGLTESDT